MNPSARNEVHGVWLSPEKRGDVVKQVSIKAISYSLIYKSLYHTKGLLEWYFYACYMCTCIDKVL